MDMRLTSNVYWKAIKKDTGEVISQGEKHNLIVNSGLEYVAKLLNGLNTAPFAKLAVGTDNTPPLQGDIALGAQDSIIDATVDYEADYKAVFYGTFTFTSGVTLQEAGLFVTDAGVMLNRVTFTDPQNVGSGIDFYLKFTITVGRT